MSTEAVAFLGASLRRIVASEQSKIGNEAAVELAKLAIEQVALVLLARGNNQDGQVMREFNETCRSLGFWP